MNINKKQKTILIGWISIIIIMGLFPPWECNVDLKSTTSNAKRSFTPLSSGIKYSFIGRPPTFASPFSPMTGISSELPAAINFRILLLQWTIITVFLGIIWIVIGGSNNKTLKILKIIYHSLAIFFISIFILVIIIILFVSFSNYKIKMPELKSKTSKSDVILLPFAEVRDKERAHEFNSIVASFTVKGEGLKNKFIFLKEKPDDKIIFLPILKPATDKKGKMEGSLVPAWPKGDGSVLRFNGTVWIEEEFGDSCGKAFNNIVITSSNDNQLVFKKEKRGWLYISGRGNITYKDQNRVVMNKNF